MKWEPETPLAYAGAIAEEQIAHLRRLSKTQLLGIDEARMLKSHGEFLLAYAAFLKKNEDKELDDMSEDELLEKARELLGDR